MFRYRVAVYYDEKATETEVAQEVVVVAEDDRQAVAEIRSTVAKDAVDGKLRGMKILEKEDVMPGVKHRGNPYIPFSRLAAASGQKKTKEQGAETTQS
jgi:hypothetical protein